MTTHSHHPRARRRADVPSILLLLCGLIFGVLAYWLVEAHGFNPLVLVPSVVVATTGAAHLTKWEAPRD